MIATYELIIGDISAKDLNPLSYTWDTYYYRITDTYPLHSVTFNSSAPMILVKDLCDTDRIMLALRGLSIGDISHNVLSADKNSIVLKYRIYSGII